jgi:hypothetical protein
VIFLGVFLAGHAAHAIWFSFLFFVGRVCIFRSTRHTSAGSVPKRIRIRFVGLRWTRMGWLWRADLQSSPVTGINGSEWFWCVSCKDIFNNISNMFKQNELSRLVGSAQEVGWRLAMVGFYHSLAMPSRWPFLRVPKRPKIFPNYWFKKIYNN